MTSDVARIYSDGKADPAAPFGERILIDAHLRTVSYALRLRILYPCQGLYPGKNSTQCFRGAVERRGRSLWNR